MVRHRVGIIIRLCKYGSRKYRAGADVPSIRHRKNFGLYFCNARWRNVESVPFSRLWQITKSLIQLICYFLITALARSMSWRVGQALRLGSRQIRVLHNGGRSTASGAVHGTTIREDLPQSAASERLFTFGQ